MAEYDHLTDDILFEALCRRDERSLAALYDRHARAAYSLALRVVGDHQRAEDVIQEAFLKLWRQPDLYHSERGAFRSWFLQSVRNRAVDFVRAGAKEVVPGGDPWSQVFWASIPSSDSDPADQAAREIDGEAVAHALESLPDDQRSVIEMAYYGGLTQSEIARQIGAPLGTVKTRIRTGMIRLRDLLSAFTPGGGVGAA